MPFAPILTVEFCPLDCPTRCILIHVSCLRPPRACNIGDPFCLLPFKTNVQTKIRNDGQADLRYSTSTSNAGRVYSVLGKYLEKQDSHQQWSLSSAAGAGVVRLPGDEAHLLDGQRHFG